MTLQFHGHPFSSYCQKVLIALYENGTPFDFRRVDFGDPASVARFAALWPLKQMPVLVDGARVVVESSVIVEYLDLHHPGPAPMLPRDARAALEVRRMDRIFDNHVSTPLQRIVFDAIRPADARDAVGVVEARARLQAAYAWLDGELAGRTWAAGETFGLADCAAAPALFYADWVEPIPERLATLRAYRARLLARPSYARAVDEARPFRALFPLGAPDRD
jgi:glutathione S-transferase